MILFSHPLPRPKRSAAKDGKALLTASSNLLLALKHSVDVDVVEHGETDGIGVLTLVEHELRELDLADLKREKVELMRQKVALALGEFEPHLR